jgi:hypothetical protein
MVWLLSFARCASDKRRMSDELQMLDRAIRAYLNTPPGRTRDLLERLVDDLEQMIREGRQFEDYRAR